MDDKKLYFCFEAKDDQGKPVYVIYTAKISDLWVQQSDSPPHFTRQVAITNGVPSMGCGLFGSKFVLAGGAVPSDDYYDDTVKVKCKGVITYDLTTTELSNSDLPAMRGGKLRPLVFQLDNKLYVMDTSKNPEYGPYEAYHPKQKRWRLLHLDYFPMGKCSAGQLAHPGSKGISFFSWFVCGYCLWVSLPKDTFSYYHHAKSLCKLFVPTHDEPLPFPGMAITYPQHDFKEDVVLISFSKRGLIEGRRLRYPFSFHKKPAVIILNTKTYSRHDGDLNGYFAHFGNGTFCLTAFDNVDIYVHMFKISRRKCRNGEDLNIRLIDRSMHRFKYSDFSEAGHTSFSFAGCFSPSQPTGWSKESTEAKMYGSRFPCGAFEEEDDVPGTKGSIFGDEDYEMGSGIIDSDG